MKLSRGERMALCVSFGEKKKSVHGIMKIADGSEKYTDPSKSVHFGCLGRRENSYSILVCVSQYPIAVSARTRYMKRYWRFSGSVIRTFPSHVN